VALTYAGTASVGTGALVEVIVVRGPCLSQLGGRRSLSVGRKGEGGKGPVEQFWDATALHSSNSFVEAVDEVVRG